jgi:hypothetical protein
LEYIKKKREKDRVREHALVELYESEADESVKRMAKST